MADRKAAAAKGKATRTVRQVADIERSARKAAHAAAIRFLSKASKADGENFNRVAKAIKDGS